MAAQRKGHDTAPRPSVERTLPRAGRVLKLFIGQGHGIVRMDDGREVFFHRSDMKEGASFNALAVGDEVTCEVIDDRISGARAFRVAPRRRRRG